MKKIIAFALASLVLLGTSTVAFAWWDRLEQEATDQSLDMGYGVRLVLEDETTEDQGVLVPAGSFYAAVDGYTTEYVFTYELNLEEDLDDFDLLIDIENLTIGGVDYDTAANVHGPLSVVIETDTNQFVEWDAVGEEWVAISVEGAIALGGPTTNLRLNEVLQGDGTVTITLTFTLMDHTEDAPFEGDLVEAYEALAGKEIKFDIAFEIPAYGEQSNEEGFNVHPDSE